MLVGLQYAACFTSQFWHLQYKVAPWYKVRVVTEILDTMYHLRLKQTTMLLIFWPETLDIQTEFMSEPYNATKHL